MQSIAFTDAEAFFTRSGPWAESRTVIGDFLDLHPDQLEVIGRRFLTARRSREASPEAAGQTKTSRRGSLLRLARPAGQRRSRTVPATATWLSEKVGDRATLMGPAAMLEAIAA
jgi:hypothetical protein